MVTDLTDRAEALVMCKPIEAYYLKYRLRVELSEFLVNPTDTAYCNLVTTMGDYQDAVSAMEVTK